MANASQNFRNLNWNKIQSEINRLSNVEELKKELKKLKTEIRKFDIYAHLSPAAATRLKKLEKRALEINTTIRRLESTLEREFRKVLEQLKLQGRQAQRTFRTVQTKSRKSKRSGAAGTAANPRRKTSKR